jgi:hypothetical protein
MVRGTSVVKRIVWIRQLLTEIGTTPEILGEPTVVLADNTQANRI